jgi:hypothetical protein
MELGSVEEKSVTKTIFCSFCGIMERNAMMASFNGSRADSWNVLALLLHCSGCIDVYRFCTQYSRLASFEQTGSLYRRFSAAVFVSSSSCLPSRR